jgi:hypothetical protein
MEPEELVALMEQIWLMGDQSRETVLAVAMYSEKSEPSKA